MKVKDRNHVAWAQTGRWTFLSSFRFVVGLAVTLGLPLVAPGQDALPRVTLTESARATIAEPGGAGRLNNAIGSLAYSSDGSILAAGMRDPNLILLLDPATLAIRGRLEGHIALVMDVTFSPDGKWLASAGMDGTLRVWDLAAKRERLVVDKFQGYVRQVVISPDASRVFTGETARGRGTVQAWDLAEGRLIDSVKNYDHGIEKLAISPDGHSMATTSRDNSIRTWDTATLRPKSQYESEGPWANDLVYLPDGKSLAAVFSDYTLRMFDSETMKLRYKVQTDANTFLYLTVSPDGTILATASGTRISFWRSSDGTQLTSIPASDSRVATVRFSPDGRSIAVAGMQGSIRVFRVNREGK